MNTGICKITLHIPGNQSLKDKRRTVKSIIAKLRNQYNVSIAEVDNYDLWQMATLGFSYVSNSNQHVDEVMTKAIQFITYHYPEVEIVSQEIEIIHGP
jgi:uncharacterized protein YlxP (DUF503 family)